MPNGPVPRHGGTFGVLLHGGNARSRRAVPSSILRMFAGAIVDRFPYTNVLGQPYDSGAYVQSLSALELVNLINFVRNSALAVADGKLRGVGNRS
jgi:hypothetical protein